MNIAGFLSKIKLPPNPIPFIEQHQNMFYARGVSKASGLYRIDIKQDSGRNTEKQHNAGTPKNGCGRLHSKQNQVPERLKNIGHSPKSGTSDVAPHLHFTVLEIGRQNRQSEMSTKW